MSIGGLVINQQFSFITRKKRTINKNLAIKFNKHPNGLLWRGEQLCVLSIKAGSVAVGVTITIKDNTWLQFIISQLKKVYLFRK